MLIKTDNLRSIESVLIQGDLSQLSQGERRSNYSRLCESLGFNSLTHPFAYIQLNGELKLYALQDATKQLRKIYNVSLRITSQKLVADSLKGNKAIATDSQSLWIEANLHDQGWAVSCPATCIKI